MMTCWFGLALLSLVTLTDAMVSFIRWGRRNCPYATDLVYRGYMAGPNYNLGGSGANLLCMHGEPKFVNGSGGFNSMAARIYGVELEYSSSYKTQELLKSNSVPNGELHNLDMPCVRCYHEYYSDVIMVPGRPDCGGTDTGYKLLYKGILVSQQSGNSRNRQEYVCLDEAPEGRTGGGGSENNDQAVIYPVEVGCGSLPCGPYIDGMEATCAVCAI